MAHSLTPFQALLDRLAQMDNRVGYSCGRKLKRRLLAASRAAFDARVARLGPGDICLDLGANIGEFTQILARTGATVHAYEPDPETFATLRANVGRAANVVLHQKAVGARPGTVQLRRTLAYAEDRARQSQASSVYFDAPETFGGATIAVEQVGFREVLAALPKPAALIKMDIEGAEFDILDDIFDGGMPANMDALFVETHEGFALDRLPALRRHQRVAMALEQPYINLYWP